MPRLGDITRDSGYKTHIWHACVICGKERWVQLNRDQPVSERCRSCAAKASWQKLPKPLRPLPTGENHWKWKGGRTVCGYGYICILQPNHHRANKIGYVREHILVWEKAHNRLLPNGWVVHHLNGIKTDNRPVNLVALPSMKHTHVLQAKAKRIQELEALLNNQNQLL